jgi:hypothetical protein
LIQLAVFFHSKILKPEEQKPHLKPFMSMLLESSIRTKWSNFEFSRVALKQSLDLIEKYKEQLREPPLTVQEKELLEGHVKLYAELVEKAKNKENHG